MAGQAVSSGKALGVEIFTNSMYFASAQLHTKHNASYSIKFL